MSSRSPTRTSLAAPNAGETSARETENRLEAMKRVVLLSEENLADFFDHSPFGLLLVGRTGIIRGVNRAGLGLLGCDSERCLNHRLREFFADPSVETTTIQRLSRGEGVNNYRVKVLRQDGTVRHVLIDANGVWERGRMLSSRWFLRDITRRAELEREVLVAAERERQRIGLDLHDDLCQLLTGIEFLSQALARNLSGHAEHHADRAMEIARMVRQAISRTRELAHGLSPLELETQGLAGALHELSERAHKMCGVDCRFRCESPRMKPDPALDIHLYRIAQEAVANAVRHGRANRIEVSLARKRDKLILAVKDFGIGMRRKPLQGNGIGVQGMMYRAGVIGGSLSVEPNPGGGTVVLCEVDNYASTETEEDRRS